MSSAQPVNDVVGPATGTWHLDPIHSCIIFVAHYLRFGRVQGTFGEATGTVTVAGDPADSTVDITINAAGINTGVRMRDDHLRSADFLDVENHPEIRFTSTGLETGGRAENAFLMHGDLTVHGTSRPVTLECQWVGEAPDYMNPDDTYGHFFTGNAQIRLSDFGIGDGGPLPWGGRLVGDRIDIVLEVRLQNNDPAEPLPQNGHTA
ncbi:MAG: YceI family protein [Nocardiopsaceae bacterium]|nr:YceI family protein [Nocardiopsaceae bacterium]